MPRTSIKSTRRMNWSIIVSWVNDVSKRMGYWFRNLNKRTGNIEIQAGVIGSYEIDLSGWIMSKIRRMRVLKVNERNSSINIKIAIRIKRKRTRK